MDLSKGGCQKMFLKHNIMTMKRSIIILIGEMKLPIDWYFILRKNFNIESMMKKSR